MSNRTSTRKSTANVSQTNLQKKENGTMKNIQKEFLPANEELEKHFSSEVNRFFNEKGLLKEPVNIVVEVPEYYIYQGETNNDLSLIVLKVPQRHEETHGGKWYAFCVENEEEQDAIVSALNLSVFTPSDLLEVNDKPSGFNDVTQSIKIRGYKPPVDGAPWAVVMTVSEHYLDSIDIDSITLMRGRYIIAICQTEHDVSEYLLSFTNKLKNFNN